MIIAPIVDHFYRPCFLFYFSSLFVMVICDNYLSLTAKEKKVYSKMNLNHNIWQFAMIVTIHVIIWD